MTEEPRWFVGIDWASEVHQVCLVDAAGKITGERRFPHGGAGLAELRAWLLAMTGAEPAAIAVAIEVPHGPIVETLLERGFAVYAVNPKQLDRFRDRFTVAGAKDNRRDAHVLGDAVRTDRHCFRRIVAEDAIVIELREWSRMSADLQQERNRLASRVRQTAVALLPAGAHDQRRPRRRLVPRALGSGANACQGRPRSHQQRRAHPEDAPHPSDHSRRNLADLAATAAGRGGRYH
jgi:transposase